MVATAQLDEYNGAGQTQTANVTNCNFGNTDAPNITPASNPITAGTNAFEKWWKMAFAGTFNQVDNLKIWKSAGNYVTGEGIDASLTESGYTAPTYATPTQTTSVVAVNVLPTTEPAGANLGIGGSLTGNLSSPGSSDYCVMQLQTTGATPPGNVNQKTFTFQYDEQ